MRKAAAIVLSTLLCLTIFFFAFTPSGRGVWNSWLHALQTSDDATLYATRKKVEDTCRAMLSSYASDCLTYAQYKSSPVEEKRSWAEQTKMRANKTAATYNEYILKKTYVFRDSIPEDIASSLAYLD